MDRAEPRPIAVSPSTATVSLRALRRSALVAVAVYLFVGALQVMKTGAADLGVIGAGGLVAANPASAFGLGWLGALVVLSGSPVAASALALVAAGSLTEIEGFAMLTGSRLGASFVVLLVGVVYALRGGRGKRGKPVSTAVIALSLTAAIYLPGSLVGLALLRWGPVHDVDLGFTSGITGVVQAVYGGLLERIDHLPGVMLFAGGLGLLLVAFRLVDAVVPELSEDAIERSRATRLRDKWPMFALGCVVALVTMSVSVALTILVPLVARNVVKRDEIFPYIMGANITTLGDTLLAAIMLGSASAVKVVLAGIAGVTVVTLAVLILCYRPVHALIWRFQAGMMRSRPRLAGFTAALFAVPIAIVVGAGWLG